MILSMTMLLMMMTENFDLVNTSEEQIIILYKDKNLFIIKYPFLSFLFEYPLILVLLQATMIITLQLYHPLP